MLLLTFGINPDLFIKTVWTALAIWATIFVIWLMITESKYDGKLIQNLLNALMTFFESLKSLLKTEKSNQSSGKCLQRYYIRGIKGNESRIGNKQANIRLDPPYQAQMANDTKDTRAQPLAARFDSDSFIIGVDNHASKCMSNRRQHFVGPIQPLTNQRVQGVGGLLQVKGKGTIRWRIKDDDGKIRNVLIRGALYIPDLPICLLFPQHWSQQANDNLPQKNGTW